MDDFTPTNPPPEYDASGCKHERIRWERNMFGFTLYRVCLQCGAQEK